MKIIPVLFLVVVSTAVAGDAVLTLPEPLNGVRVGMSLEELRRLRPRSAPADLYFPSKAHPNRDQSSRDLPMVEDLANHAVFDHAWYLVFGGTVTTFWMSADVRAVEAQKIAAPLVAAMAERWGLDYSSETFRRGSSADAPSTAKYSWTREGLEGSLTFSERAGRPGSFRIRIRISDIQLAEQVGARYDVDAAMQDRTRVPLGDTARVAFLRRLRLTPKTIAESLSRQRGGKGIRL